MHVRPTLLCALAILTLASAPAHAQPAFAPEVPAHAQPAFAPEAPVAPAPRVRTERYSLTLMTADAAGVAAAVALDGPAIFYSSYLLAGPIVHLFHGNVGTAVGSFGLRAGLPMAGLMLGAAAGDCGYAATGECSRDFRVHGLLLGATTALLVDWIFLARTTTREPAEQPALLHAGSLRANPGFQVSRTGTVLLGLDGRF